MTVKEFMSISFETKVSIFEYRKVFKGSVWTGYPGSNMWEYYADNEIVQIEAVIDENTGEPVIYLIVE